MLYIIIGYKLAEVFIATSANQQRKKVPMCICESGVFCEHHQIFHPRFRMMGFGKSRLNCSRVI